MNLSEVLAILQEVSKILEALRGMGVTVNGTLDLPTLIALVKK